MILLATLVLAVTGKMMSGLVLKPSNLLKPAEVTSHEKVAQLPVGVPSIQRDSGHG